jgi:hypothetical protein
MIFGSGALADSKAVAWPFTKMRNFYAAQRISFAPSTTCARGMNGRWWPEKTHLFELFSTGLRSEDYQFSV